MAKQTVTLYLFERVEGFDKGKQYVSTYAEHQMAHFAASVVLLGTQEVEVDFPGINAADILVNQLEEAKAILADKAMHDLAEIDRKIAAARGEV